MRNSPEQTLVITGGGTGGHVFPGIAIADEFKKRGWKILYVGSERGFEAKWVPARGYPIHFVRSGALKNQGLLKRIQSLWSIVSGIRWSLEFLRTSAPTAVIGVGGYVSFPVCIAAWMLGIPVFLQEQNVTPGFANRFLGRIARMVFLGFPQAVDGFSGAKTCFTGNPLRPEIEEIEYPPVTSLKPQLLILGGSQGAQSINRAVTKLLPEIQQNFPGLSILHQTGASDESTVRMAYEKAGYPLFKVQAFIEDMAAAYKNTTCLVCRSGALTIAELVRTQRPAVLVPYPRKGVNDQVANADYLEAAGAGRKVEQGIDFINQLRTSLFSLLRNYPKWSSGYSRLRSHNAASVIADTLIANL